jgi:nicotinamide mononucleotide transporter
VNSFEAIAALISLIAVVLAARRSVWNFPFGLVGVLLYTKIFYDAQLYSDTLLQLYFFVIQLYGWWHWAQHRDATGHAVVETSSKRDRWLIVVAVLIITATLGFGMSRTTNAALPWWDASIAGLSVVAQILSSRRKLENWPLWIGANIIGIGVYSAKALYITAGLYAVLLLLALFGWQRWRKEIVTAAL